MVHYNESECSYLSQNTILTPRKTLKPHNLPPPDCLASRMESLQPIEVLKKHESGSIQFKGDIEEIRSSIQATAHCTPTFFIPNEQFPPILTQINMITPLDVSLHIFPFIHYTFTDLNSYVVKLEPPTLARLNDLYTLIQFAQR
ncbi:hypothetical protein O181_039559 [Austropuccinia psidii MF-1]|uniref:Uncharacterized protein n=1 Tax=Austropuccinia psidii MF-1 TaxID=1389203 RepID=A0A9Q3DAP5_9BASI|nr:hypothetical protein [Austropuccinia psidii MF-1]